MARKPQKIEIGARDVGVMPARIVEASGSTKVDRGSRRNMIEDAMSAAAAEASLEAEAIWARTDLDEDAKRQQIDAIMNPDALRERKMAARKDARDRFYGRPAEG